MILKNKGMFIEEYLTYCFNELNDDGKCMIFKTSISNKIVKNLDDGFTKVKLINNNFCDYIGVYNGVYIEIESKETELDYFNIKNITKKQINKLISIKNHRGLGLIIIYFHKNEKIYICDINEIINAQKRNITIDWFNENCYNINLTDLNTSILKIFDHYLMMS